MLKPTLSAMAVSVSLALSSHAIAQAMSKDDYKAGKDSITAEYDSGKKKCESLSGNAKDICMAKVKGKKNVEQADLDARYKDTDKARYEAAITRSKTEYDIAIQKCDDEAGDAKDACVKEAKAAEAAAKVDIDKKYNK